jgi:hypothetical protein
MTAVICATAQTDVEKQASALAEQLIKLHRSWSAASSKGASVEVKELSRKDVPGKGAVVQYHFYVKGLPQNDLYEYVNWTVNQRTPQTALHGISMGKDGLLMCAGRADEECGTPSKKDDPIEFTYISRIGEPFRVAITSSDHPDVRVTTIIVPVPIEAQNKGCVLSVVRLLPKFELAYFEGHGFTPNTEVSFDMKSYSEEHTATAKVDESGNLQFAAMPNVAGHESGTTHVRTRTASCSPSFSFEWGS